jgi:hypothetical protein
MLAMVPRAAMARGAPGPPAPGGRGKPRPGLGSKPGTNGDAAAPADGSAAAGRQGGSGKQEPAVKDNDYFRNLFSKGGSL